MGEPAGRDLYELDFYAWTQDQARRLRALKGDNRFDAARVAEEIQESGQQKRDAVASHLAQTVAHLVKAAWIDNADLHRTWRHEIDRHQDQACFGHTPAIRRDLDVETIWRRGVRLANKSFRTHGEPELPETPPCPFTLAALLSEAFDTDAALGKVRGALRRDTG
ncbi:MAG: DUF29 domain-containing protein [Rhodovibrio sp.]|nr:DUF29 domain-containing protein [Rhodovibrio sp.]